MELYSEDLKSRCDQFRQKTSCDFGKFSGNWHQKIIQSVISKAKENGDHAIASDGLPLYRFQNSCAALSLIGLIVDTPSSQHW